MRRESATLVIAELYALADELGQSGEGLRRDCADVLRRAIAQIELQRRDAEAGERRGTEPFPSDLEEEPQSLRRALDGKWLAADARIDELLSTARDEIIAFATAAESDLARCERGLRHLSVPNTRPR